MEIHPILSPYSRKGSVWYVYRKECLCKLAMYMVYSLKTEKTPPER